MAASETISAKRVRSSERALRIALKVAQEAGLTVEKLCITGAQIEVRFGGVEAPGKAEDHGGPEDW